MKLAHLDHCLEETILQELVLGEKLVKLSKVSISETGHLRALVLGDCLRIVLLIPFTSSDEFSFSSVGLVLRIL